MKGTLILNQDLYPRVKSFAFVADSFRKSAERAGIEFEVLTNAVAAAGLYESSFFADFVLFWDKDVRLASLLEHSGFPVFNSPSAIEYSDDKSLTYLKLSGHDIEMPDTLIVPKAFYPNAGISTEFVLAAEKRLSYPLVAKECFGSLGEQVYLINDRDGLYEILRERSNIPMILQKYAASSRGRDMRLYVVGDAVRAAMLRHSVRDFRANAALGSHTEAFSPSAEQCETALSACRALGLDFAGVDLLFGESGKPLLCEVNSNALFERINECCGVRIEDAILSHIIKKVKEEC